MTTLEGIVVTSSTEWTIELLLEQFKALCDRVTVAVDLDSPQARELLQLSESLEVDNIVPLHVGGYIELVIQRLYNSARCDWVLRLDDDELISTKLAVALRDMFEQPIYDYWYYSRAHITSLNPYQYISDDRKFGNPEMWVDFWPNLQLRLFKKGHVVHHGKIHEGPEGKGNPGTILERPILHYNLLKPRKERERIVRKYKTVGGEDDIRGDTLLWEDFNVTPVDCPYKPWIPE